MFLGIDIFITTHEMTLIMSTAKIRDNLYEAP